MIILVWSVRPLPTVEEVVFRKHHRQYGQLPIYCDMKSSCKQKFGVFEAGSLYLTFLEWQHSKSLGSISGSLRKYDQFLSLIPGPLSHLIDVLVTGLTLPKAGHETVDRSDQSVR